MLHDCKQRSGRLWKLRAELTDSAADWVFSRDHVALEQHRPQAAADEGRRRERQQGRRRSYHALLQRDPQKAEEARQADLQEASGTVRDQARNEREAQETHATGQRNNQSCKENEGNRGLEMLFIFTISTQTSILLKYKFIIWF